MNKEKSLHVAIIPDGNRRWAKKNALNITAGHERVAQYEHLKQFLLEAKRIGVQYLSFWAFSTENWKRPVAEQKVLFELLDRVITEMRNDISKEQICFRWIGRRDRIPKNLQEKMELLEQESQTHNGLILQLCLDYGGRDEIVRAVNKAIEQGTIVTEETFMHLLDTTDTPDPDLIIRTSGEKRLSGFMPFQGVYAELAFVDKFFPDFTPQDFSHTVEEFRTRERRMGQ